MARQAGRRSALLRRLAFFTFTVGALVTTVGPLVEAQTKNQDTSVAESTFYYPLDLARAAREQYGRSATALATGNHLYSWVAKVGTDSKPLDLRQAVSSQYGPSYTLAAVGVSLWDWRAVNLATLPNTVLPVMAIASDRFFSVRGVGNGLARYVSALTTMRSWYKARSGKTFRLLQPLVVPTNRTSEQWNQLSASTTDPAHRFDLLYEAIAAYRAQLPGRTENLRVAIAPSPGTAPTSGWGPRPSTGSLSHHRGLRA